MSRPKYKILFALYSWFYVKNMMSVIERLAEAGHEITVAAIRHDRDDFFVGVQQLADRFDNITIKTAPKRSDTWLYVSWDLRQAACYMHFLHRRFDKAAWLRKRPHKRAPRRVVALMERWPFRFAWTRDLLRRFTERLEQAVPTDPKIDQFVLAEAPDVMIVSPLVDLDARLWDCLKSGLALGIPCIYAVHSWDNLSSKSQLFCRPHRMLVWNDIQVEEAVRYHRVPRDLVVSTGAQVFDEWFERRPSTTRQDFCASLSFDPGQRIILYVCSALNPRLKPEPDYVRSWIEAIRAAPDPVVSQANILIRPHPKRDQLWQDVTLEAFDRVAIAPRTGEIPVVEGAKALFYDSFHHSSAVVGVNTSALIEAGIIGRPVLTVLEKGYRQDQLENLHFNHLMEVSGGLLMAARNLEDHLNQLGRCLHDPAEGEAKAVAFVESFVRPHGRGKSGTGRFVAELEAVAADGPKPPMKPRLLDSAICACLWPWTIMPKYVDAGTIDSVKQPKRDPRIIKLAHLPYFRKLWLRRVTGGALKAWRRAKKARSFFFRTLRSLNWLLHKADKKLLTIRLRGKKQIVRGMKRMKKLVPRSVRQRVARRF